MLSLQFPQQIITLQVPLLYLNNIIALAIGPQYQLLCVSITLPILVLLVAQSLYRDWDGPWGNHYALNCAVCGLPFAYFDWVLLARPDGEAWCKMKYGNEKEEEKENEEGKRNGDGKLGENDVVKKKSRDMQGGSGKTFVSRLWWAMRLATTNRYVGWSNQVKNVVMEVPSDYPRIYFIVRKSLRAVFFYFIRDAMYAYTAASPHGSWMDIKHLKPALGLAGQSFWYRFWYAWVQIVLTYVTLEMANAAYGVVSVATGLANPRDCPSAFGDLRGLWSMRQAWSVVWHQQCRRMCSITGIYLTRDVLRLRRGSFASKYVQLFVGFGVSAIVHGGASMLVHRSFNDDGAFQWLMGQAVVIMVEDHVIDFGKSLGLKDSAFWRVVGFVWTVFAVGAGLEGHVSILTGHGIWVHDRGRDYFGIGPAIVV
ncbi:hypothetical protein EJ02DRAFT_503108 [Clathrospora elynae]|uniref:Wax synthase domain-containing protein n=1 Tax=Clathrospora elynae TaxID=706981 RepID=A0A6A5SP65_9PLEO|nr:hypothetical protein EJ02DRAFT_503108 [Clathrospora elynae]